LAVPGIAAAQNYAEDTVHRNADALTQVGCVRRDAAASSSGTDGDYSTINCDATGALRVTGGVGDGVAQGSATAGQLGVLSQGAVTTAAPTYVNAQTSPLSLTTGGELRVSGGGGGTQYAVDVALGATPTGSLAVYKRDDALSTLTPIEGDAIDGRVDAFGAIWTTLSDGAGARAILAQGSTTSGQYGLLGLGAVTTAAPVYTNAQSSPLSLTTAGDLRVAVTQYAEDTAHVTADSLMMAGVVQSAACGTALSTNGDRSLLQTDATGYLCVVGGVAQGSTTSGQVGPLMQGAVTTAAPSYTTAQTSPLSLTTAGELRVTGGGNTAHDAAAAGVNPTLVGCYSSAAAPSDVSADTDATRSWCLRNGSLVTNLAASGTLITSTGSSLNVNLTNASAGGTAMVDDAAFTVGTTQFTPAGGTYKSTRDLVDDNDGGAFAMTQRRALYTSPETPAGDPMSDETANAMRAMLVDSSGTFITPSAVDASSNARSVGAVAHDAAGGAVDPLLQGCYASAAAPTSVSADADATRAWCLRNGARAIQPTFAGELALAGNGVSGVGVQRVTLASDSTGQVAPIAKTSGGTTPFRRVSTLSTNAVNVKASAGQVYTVIVSNVNAAARYLHLYNTAGAPTCNTGIISTFIIPGATTGAGNNPEVALGIEFSSGIGICITTTYDGTGDVAANEIIANVFYK
jgi:hypothetical protein